MGGEGRWEERKGGEGKQGTKSQSYLNVRCHHWLDSVFLDTSEGIRWPMQNYCCLVPWCIVFIEKNVLSHFYG